VHFPTKYTLEKMRFPIKLNLRKLRFPISNNIAELRKMFCNIKQAFALAKYNQVCYFCVCFVCYADRHVNNLQTKN